MTQQTKKSLSFVLNDAIYTDNGEVLNIEIDGNPYDLPLIHRESKKNGPKQLERGNLKGEALGIRKLDDKKQEVYTELVYKQSDEKICSIVIAKPYNDLLNLGLLPYSETDNKEQSDG